MEKFQNKLKLQKSAEMQLQNGFMNFQVCLNIEP